MLKFKRWRRDNGGYYVDYCYQVVLEDELIGTIYPSKELGWIYRNSILGNRLGMSDHYRNKMLMEKS